jgi:two-component system NtrC family response regulator
MRPTVLIVDDDEAITQQLFWTLSEDYDVVTANDMQTAARRARIYEPDVAILDLHFPPTLDSPEVGLRILDYLRAHVPHSRVVIISSSNDIESQKACYARGADEFFDKPFDTEKLLAAMRRLAPLRQLDFG